MATIEEPVTAIKAACYCGQLEVSVDILSEDLPIDLWLCSCNTCRRSSGQLAVICLHLPKSHGALHVSGQASRFATSHGYSGLCRCFCGTCGTSVYEDSDDPNRISINAGALTSMHGVSEPRGILFSDDTRDGGLAEWLPTLTAYPTSAEERGDYQPLQQSEQQASQDRLHCRCVCGGVEYWVTRPGPESHVQTSFIHGMFVPELKSGDKPPSTPKWWIRGNGTKYPAVLCACNDCRRAAGYDLTPWGYVPVPNLLQKDGKPVDFGMGTLRTYESSKGTYRYFCGTCGAKAFYGDEGTPLLNINLGLANAASGVRAEEWFSWAGTLCDGELARNKFLANALEAGLQDWDRRTGKAAEHEKTLM